MMLVIIGAGLWGISGTVAQFLFSLQKFSPEWLVVVRLLLSGFILLILTYTKDKHKVWRIWKNKRDGISLLLFSIFGMLAVQYTYFAAIKFGNAATATVLQYLGPVVITCYLSLRSKRLPNIKEMIALFLAIMGTFLLVTHGHMHRLSISGLTLFWGISSAFAVAFYTLQPYKLLMKWGSMLVVGWAMLIGGIGFSLIHPPWRFIGTWSLRAFFAVVFIVIFGTLIAFYCYLESLKYISSSEASLLGCVEPLSATVLSVIWLHVSFSMVEWLGMLCILSTIAILSLIKHKSDIT
ncbi:DMT family transporter [Terrilactibacillus laevilacticus]|uniref:DMT family transporter n=1 Tax=Terrilactibacillus laevilacticus TaxID=1380157 RepID=UPI001146B111|nr:EamA family transporter [Terrilactibacillus laevilacticus]